MRFPSPEMILPLDDPSEAWGHIGTTGKLDSGAKQSSKVPETTDDRLMTKLA